MNGVLKSVVSGVIGIAGFLIGEFDGLYKALLVLIIADYITGVIVAIVKSSFPVRWAQRVSLRKSSC